jgi:hypothetical protein
LLRPWQASGGQNAADLFELGPLLGQQGLAAAYRQLTGGVFHSHTVQAVPSLQAQGTLWIRLLDPL